MAFTVPLYLQYQDVLTRPEHMTGPVPQTRFSISYATCVASHIDNASSFCGAPGSKIHKMTWCWKPPWRPKVATS